MIAIQVSLPTPAKSSTCAFLEDLVDGIIVDVSAFRSKRAATPMIDFVYALLATGDSSPKPGAECSSRRLATAAGRRAPNDLHRATHPSVEG